MICRRHLRGVAVTRDIGKCKVCGHVTSSGMKHICDNCANDKNVCAWCWSRDYKDYTAASS